MKHDELVLVPSDIGVVYISDGSYLDEVNGFSPLRYWGSLYPSLDVLRSGFLVLVPFDIGVVYINNE